MDIMHTSEWMSTESGMSTAKEMGAGLNYVLPGIVYERDKREI